MNEPKTDRSFPEQVNSAISTAIVNSDNNRRLAELLGSRVERVSQQGPQYRMTDDHGYKGPFRTSEEECWRKDGAPFTRDASTCLWAWEHIARLLYLSGKFDDWTMRVERRSWLGETRWEAIIWAWSMPPYTGKHVEKLIGTGQAYTELDARVRCMIAVLDALKNT